MIIKLSKKEKEQIFLDAMCNGLSSVNYWGFEMETDSIDYKLAKELLIKSNSECCFEDVLLKMLKINKTINFIDVEGDGEYSKTLTIQMVYNNIEKTPIKNLLNIINETDDATDADVVLQTVLFEEVIFG